MLNEIIIKNLNKEIASSENVINQLGLMLSLENKKLIRFVYERASIYLDDENISDSDRNLNLETLEVITNKLQSF